ncbi:MAG TPA: AAA family ATPase [Pseudonocardiaceae bacterium]|jgi:predicted ATPase|nr:AAA family ATPase [Pseudonocardiaceae bacterium]
MLIDRLDVAHGETSAWPFSIPAVRDVVAHGLRLTSNLVVFIGANGSGKSTLLEAIAEAYGLDVRGGHGGRRYGSYLDKSPLGAALRLARTATGRRFTGRNAKGFFLRAETAFGMLAYMTDMSVAGYGEQPSWEVSHGESYLHAIQGRFTGPGLYLLDEAEGPLSFQSTLALLYQLQDLAEREDTQVVYSTHSPMVAALPGAQILELTDSGIAERKWDELEMVQLWRSFLARPEKFFDT